MPSGPHPNHARVRQHAARGVAQDGAERGRGHVLQGAGPAVGSPDPLHHDEVRLLREDCRAAI